MRIKNITCLLGALVVLIGTTGNSHALQLTSANSDWSGSIPGNPDADDVEDITGTSFELTEVYKQNVGGSEEGSFAGSYTTQFFNTPSEPQDATITYDGAPDPVISGNPIYVLAKDGNHDPIWYIWDISGWDGTETIEITGLWPEQGAISHVTILTGGGSVPDAGSTLVLLGLAVGALGLARRKVA